MPAPVLKRCGHCGGLIRRRGAHSGRFLPPAARDAAPLLHAAPAGSERIAKGNRTRAARRQHGHPDPAVVALVKAATAVRDALDLIDAGSTDECQALIDGLNVAIAGVIGPARVGTAARAPVAA